jgi:hypothetical protein
MKDRDRIYRRWLLGKLPEHEREALEERALADGELFERLLIAEEELVDARVRGELSARDRRRFDASLATSPRLRERLRIARLLAAEADRVAATRPAAAWKPAVELRRWLSRPLPAALAAAALLLSLGVPIYLYLQRAAPSGPTSPLREPFVVVLQPAELLRVGEEPVAPIDLPADATELELLLELEPPAGEAFTAVVVDARGEELRRFTGLERRRLDWGEAVALELPLEPFLGEPFEVRLLAAGTGEEVASYRFHLRPSPGAR